MPDTDFEASEDAPWNKNLAIRMTEVANVIMGTSRQALSDPSQIEQFLSFACAQPEYFSILSNNKHREVMQKIVELSPISVTLPYFQTCKAAVGALNVLRTDASILFGHYGKNMGRLCSMEENSYRWTIRKAMLLFARIFEAFSENFPEMSRNNKAISCMCQSIGGIYGVQYENDNLNLNPGVPREHRVDVDNQLVVLGQTMIGASDQMKTYHVFHNHLCGLLCVFIRACHSAGRGPEKLLCEMIHDSDKLSPMIYERSHLDNYIFDKNALHFYIAVTSSNSKARTYVLGELTNRFMNGFDMDSASKLLSTCICSIASEQELQCLEVSLSSLSVLATCFRTRYQHCLEVLVQKCFELNYHISEVIDGLTTLLDCSEPRERWQGIVRCLIELKAYSNATKVLSTINPVGICILCSILSLNPSYFNSTKGTTLNLNLLRDVLSTGLTSLRPSEIRLIVNNEKGLDLILSILDSSFIDSVEVFAKLWPSLLPDFVAVVRNRRERASTKFRKIQKILSKCDSNAKTEFSQLLNEHKRKNDCQENIKWILGNLN